MARNRQVLLSKWTWTFLPSDCTRRYMSGLSFSSPFKGLGWANSWMNDGIQSGVEIGDDLASRVTPQMCALLAQPNPNIMQPKESGTRAWTYRYCRLAIWGCMFMYQFWQRSTLWYLGWWILRTPIKSCSSSLLLFTALLSQSWMMTVRSIISWARNIAGILSSDKAVISACS